MISLILISVVAILLLINQPKWMNKKSKYSDKEMAEGEEGYEEYEEMANGEEGYEEYEEYEENDNGQEGYEEQMCGGCGR